MKKQFNLLLMAALVCGLSLGVTSCKSDEDVTSDGDLANQISVDSNLLTHGVEVDIEGGTVDVTIDGKGTWMATIDGADWVGILKEQATYTGKQTLTLSFDRNLTNAGRRTQLVIIDENGFDTSIPVYQSPLYKGQEPSNGSAAAFSSKGLGHGVNFNYFLNLNNQGDRVNKETNSTSLNTRQVINNDVLFNFMRIRELQQQDILPFEAYTETPIEIGDMQAVMCDKVYSEDKSLKAEAKLGIELGILNVEAQFKYSSHKKEDRAKIDYNIVRRAPMYDVRIASGEVSAYAFQYSIDHLREITDEEIEAIEKQEENWKKANSRRKGGKAELTATQQRQIDQKWANLYTQDFDGVFSMCFSRWYGQLAYWVPELTSEDSDEAQKATARKNVKEAMQMLDDYYGPFYLTQAEYGGSFNIMCKVDTSYTNGRDTIGGTLSANLAGIGSLGGSVTYSSEGSNLFRNSNCNFQVFGGKAQDITSALFRLTHSAQMTDFESWNGVLNGWIDTMRSPENPKYGDLSEQSHAELLTFTMKPLWHMMPDAEVAAFARAWFVNRYWDKGILAYLNIIEGSEDCNELQEFFDLYLRESKTKPSLGKYEDEINSLK